jgi:DnaJ-class molecular chaperone
MAEGKCPDCRGRGYFTFSCEWITPFECENCQGTGLLTFAATNETEPSN